MNVKIAAAVAAVGLAVPAAAVGHTGTVVLSCDAGANVTATWNAGEDWNRGEHSVWMHGLTGKPDGVFRSGGVFTGVLEAAKWGYVGPVAVDVVAVDSRDGYVFRRTFTRDVACPDQPNQTDPPLTTDPVAPAPPSVPAVPVPVPPVPVPDVTVPTPVQTPPRLPAKPDNPPCSAKLVRLVRSGRAGRKWLEIAYARGCVKVGKPTRLCPRRSLVWVKRPNGTWTCRRLVGRGVPGVTG